MSVVTELNGMRKMSTGMFNHRMLICCIDIIPLHCPNCPRLPISPRALFLACSLALGLQCASAPSSSACACLGICMPTCAPASRPTSVAAHWPACWLLACHTPQFPHHPGIGLQARRGCFFQHAPTIPATAIHCPPPRLHS